MQLNEEDIKEFAQLYKQEFGEELTKKEAAEMAWNIANLYEFLAEPLPSEVGQVIKLPSENSPQ